jgi:mannitol/fructose-specific phosphotransferase system IIA component (Ntr-type)
MFEKNLTIITDRKFKDKNEVISYLANLNNQNVIVPSNYEKDVLERESVVSTYVGFGVAIPHAKSLSLKSPFVIYAKFEEGVKWDESDEKVNQVFMIGVPKSEISKSLMRSSFRDELIQAKNEEEVYKLLKTIEEGMNL